MADTDARRLLAALAREGAGQEREEPKDRVASGYREHIDRAVAATEDLESATAFLAEHDLSELNAAVERAETDLSTRAESGRDALERLRDFRDAAVA